MDIRHINIDWRPELERPVLIAGFTGWNDAADAASVAVGALASSWEARRFGGAPVLTGEWGADPRRAASGDPYFLDHQSLQDEFRFGATLWTWRESCGDPHKVGDVRAGRVPYPWGEFDVDCRTQGGLIDPRVVHLEVNADFLALFVNTREIRNDLGVPDDELAADVAVGRASQFRGEDQR